METAQRFHLGKILWAIDALSSESSVQITPAHVIEGLANQVSPRVEPVYVRRPVMLATPTGDSLQTDDVPEAIDNLHRLAEEVPMLRVAEPCLLTAKSPSVGASVKELLAFARQRGADMIAVGTHARSGLPRWLLGSFAECLVDHSPIPVIVANPNIRPTKHISHVLFPTDFSPASREAFERTIDLAQELKLDVLLFHQAEKHYPEFPHPFLPPDLVVDVGDEWQRSREEEGKNWAAWGLEKSVKVKFHLGRGNEGPAHAIVHASGKLPDSLIAMASQSNALTSALIGSVTHQVIREARRPVLIIHPQKRSA